MEKKVVFTSGYKSPINPTEDFGIKEFPSFYSKKLKESLQAFCCAQTFFQQKGLEQIVLLGYKENNKITQPLAIFFATLEYDLKDHQNRPTYLLSGNLFTQKTQKSLFWQALIINKRPEEIWKKFFEENTSLQEAYNLLKTWPEYHLYKKNIQEKTVASFWKSYLFSITFLFIISLFYFFDQQENLSQTILELQKQNSQLSHQLKEKEKQNIHTKYLLTHHYEEIKHTIPEKIWKEIIHPNQYEKLREMLKKNPEHISIDKDTIENNKNDRYILKYLAKVLLLYQKEISEKFKNSNAK